MSLGTNLQLLLQHVHLLQLVPDGLRVPAALVSLQEVKLQVVETFLQLLEGVSKLKEIHRHRADRKTGGWTEDGDGGRGQRTETLHGSKVTTKTFKRLNNKRPQQQLQGSDVHVPLCVSFQNKSPGLY